MSAKPLEKPLKKRRHRGVVVGFVEDLLPPDFHDWMDIPNWPETSASIVCGLAPRRWGQIARWARSVQERVVCELLGEGHSAAEVGEVLRPRLTATRVRQVATCVYQRVVGPQDHQGDMFGGDL
jgi:hypothetical protein